VDDAPAVRVRHRVAHGDEAREQCAQRQLALAGVAAGGHVPEVEASDGVLEALAPDEAHRVERPAVGIVAQAVDGHDAGVFEVAGDQRLAQEAAAELGVVGVPRLDLLQGDLAVELGVHRDMHLAEPAAPVRADLAVPRGRSSRARPRGAVALRGGRDPPVVHGGRGAGGQLAALAAQPALDLGLDGAAVVGAEGAALLQHLAERPGLVRGPGVDRFEEGLAADDAQLQGDQAEEQVPVRGRR
jgi:hypothetical protein